MIARIRRSLSDITLRCVLGFLEFHGRRGSASTPERNLQRPRLEPGIATRADILVMNCTGRRVVHVGFCDWPLTETRIQDGTLLHLRLKEVCRSLVGIDASKDGVRRYQEAFPYDDTHICSVYDLASVAESIASCDVVLLGEVIEHLAEPLRALNEIAGLLPPGGEVMASVPNAFSLKTFALALSGVESVHPDHVAWYSPHTLTNLMGRSGLHPVRLQCCQYGTGKQYWAHLESYPWLADCILGTFRSAAQPVGNGTSPTPEANPTHTGTSEA